ncbi:hypothetical protein [Variovorax rhizosphaerae]|uniref:Uncharacterized protein n=1 Tax=Variovorax rhizosphaerae TaxID=1836200 RepID=A0ABU8WY83_9BURK
MTTATQDLLLLLRQRHSAIVHAEQASQDIGGQPSMTQRADETLRDSGDRLCFNSSHEICTTREYGHKADAVAAMSPPLARIDMASRLRALHVASQSMGVCIRRRLEPVGFEASRQGTCL